MDSITEARQALINLLHDPDVRLTTEDRDDVLTVLGMLDEYDPALV